MNGLAVVEPDSVSAPLQIFLALIAGGVLGSVVTRAIDAIGQAAERRRDRYADTVGHLVAWMEVPYRIRRRVDDTPETLARLADAIHDLQEHLANDRGWVTSENHATASRYRDACDETRKVVQVLAQAAWALPPADAPTRMNVDDLPPIDRTAADRAIDRYRTSIAWRFGWRRAARPVAAIFMASLRE